MTAKTRNIGGKERTGKSFSCMISNIARRGSRRFGKVGFITALAGSYLSGILIGVCTNSFVIGIVSSFAMATIPIFAVSYAEQRFRFDKERKLLIAMAGIQSEYMREGVTFVSAVKDALPNIPEPVYAHFKLYADTVLYFSPDSHDEAIKDLDMALDNYFFSEYLSFVIMVEDGEKALKYTMASIPEEFNSLLEINEEFSHTIERCNNSFITTMMTLPLMLAFLRAVSKDYFTLITQTLLGQIVIAAIILGFVIAGIIIRRLNCEVNFEI